jgi:hypothetical protein
MTTVAEEGRMNRHIQSQIQDSIQIKAKAEASRAPPPKDTVLRR